MKRVLVGVDGSPASDGALAWASAVAGSAEAEVVTVTVVPGPAAGRVVTASPGRTDGGSGGERHLTLTGEVCDELERAYREESADLMVVGSPGGEWFPASHLRRTAHHLAGHTDHPIAVVPSGALAADVELVLGLDGSPGSRAAAQWVAGLPLALTREVKVVHAVPNPPAPFLHDSLDAEAGGGDTWDWIEPLARAGIKVNVSAAEGDPVGALVGAADLPGAVIVIGGRPAGPNHRLRLGSVALRILDCRTGPVIIVPPAA
jgi:nucleotide-binding universal stress UspA family protein